MSNSIKNVIAKYERTASSKKYYYSGFDDDRGEITETGKVKGSAGYDMQDAHSLVNMDMLGYDLDSMGDDELEDAEEEIPEVVESKGSLSSVLIIKGDWGRGGLTLTLISTSKKPKALQKMIEDVWKPMEKKMEAWGKGGHLEDESFEGWMDEGSYVDFIYNKL